MRILTKQWWLDKWVYVKWGLISFGVFIVIGMFIPPLRPTVTFVLSCIKTVAEALYWLISIPFGG